MDERNAGDFQIHGADAQPIAAELLKHIRGLCIPWKNQPLVKRFDLALKLRIWRDLIVRVWTATYFSKPTAHLFLDGNNSKRCIETT